MLSSNKYKSYNSIIIKYYICQWLKFLIKVLWTYLKFVFKVNSKFFEIFNRFIIMLSYYCLKE